jgi:hypothetical protein
LALWGRLDRLQRPPQGSVAEHERDAWAAAVGIFGDADADPDRAASTLLQLATDPGPDSALTVVQLLRTRVRQVAEFADEHWLARIIQPI